MFPSHCKSAVSRQIHLGQLKASFILRGQGFWGTWREEDRGAWSWVKMLHSPRPRCLRELWESFYAEEILPARARGEGRDLGRGCEKSSPKKINKLCSVMGTSTDKMKEIKRWEGRGGNEFPQGACSPGLVSTETSESPLTSKYPPQTG